MSARSAAQRSPAVAVRRDDLLALTADAIAALTNRGLLKRATREVEAGQGPVLTVEPDGAVRGENPDGTRTVLPADGGVDAATCSCPASGACRHLVMLILAYQREVPGVGVDPVDWSPGEFTDDDLAKLLGARLMAVARRALRAGFQAHVRRPTPADPVPQVELDSCTVRFLVPRDLDYVHTDARRGSRRDAVALAVWAYRVADRTAPGVPEARVDVGGQPPAAAGTGLESAVNLVDELLRTGVVHSGPSLGVVFARTRRELDAAGLRWPLAAVAEIADQLRAYHDRSARHRPERVAELLAELVARHRAVRPHPDGRPTPRSRVLGTEEPAETPMRRLRLAGLGCRITGTDRDREMEVLLAGFDSPVVLVLRRRWTAPPDTTPPSGPELAGKRVAGARLGALATGTVVTESAVRSASRVVRFASSQLSRTAVTPAIGSWSELPGGLVVRDVAAFARVQRDLPPRLVRPRVAAESVRVVEVAEVLSVGYHPGDQRLDAVIADPSGGTARIVATYSAATPTALDALAAALRDTPRFVSGSLRRVHGEVHISAYAVATATTVVVPDIAAGTPAAPVGYTDTPAADPVTAALDAALALLAEAAHRGLHHLPPTFPDRLRTAAATLHSTGLRRAAAALTTLAAALTSGTPDPATWADAEIRLLVTADCR